MVAVASHINSQEQREGGACTLEQLRSSCLHSPGSSGASSCHLIRAFPCSVHRPPDLDSLSWRLFPGGLRLCQAGSFSTATWSKYPSSERPQTGELQSAVLEPIVYVDLEFNFSTRFSLVSLNSAQHELP